MVAILQCAIQTRPEGGCVHRHPSCGYRGRVIGCAKKNWVTEISLSLGSIHRGGLPKTPPKALATSPTTPRCCLVRVVQMSAGLQAYTLEQQWVRQHLPYRLFRFFCSPILYHEFGLWSTELTPSGSRERADQLPARDSAGTSGCFATRGWRVSPRYCTGSHCFCPAMCMHSSTSCWVGIPRVGGWYDAGCFVCSTSSVIVPLGISLPRDRHCRPARRWGHEHGMGEQAPNIVNNF